MRKLTGFWNILTHCLRNISLLISDGNLRLLLTILLLLTKLGRQNLQYMENTKHEENFTFLCEGVKFIALSLSKLNLLHLLLWLKGFILLANRLKIIPVIGSLRCVVTPLSAFSFYLLSPSAPEPEPWSECCVILMMRRRSGYIWLSPGWHLWHPTRDTGNREKKTENTAVTVIETFCV